MAGLELSTECFRRALNDYFLLLNRGYPEKPSLKLVGDHHRLTGNQRICLFRGITSQIKADNRRSKLTKNLNNQVIHIDGYNVLCTIMNYLLGKILFIANDGLLRDSGAVYGKIGDEQIFLRACRLLFEYVSETHVRKIITYLDSTVENFINHKIAVESELVSSNIQGEVIPIKHADSRLKKIQGNLVATSDSEIIDSITGKVADISRQALATAFKINIIDLNHLLK